MRWQQPAAGLARRAAPRQALGWAAARAGAPGAPPRPNAASRNLQEAVGPGEGGEGSSRGAGGPWPAGIRGPLGGSAGKKCKGGGEAGGPHDPAATTLRAGPRGWRRERGHCFFVSPEIEIWRLRADLSGRASSADGEISCCGASAEPIFIQPGDVSERLSGTALYEEQSFATALAGGGRASRAPGSGAAAKEAAGSVCFTNPAPCVPLPASGSPRPQQCSYPTPPL